MNGFLDLALSRRSIRKFEAKEIPNEEIEYFIKAAVSAPSGCNSQCWRFVAIKNKDIIRQLEEVVINKVESILKVSRVEVSEDYLTSKRNAVSFFAKAPVVIAVFMTGVKYYDPKFIEVLKEQGYDEEGIMKLFANYDLLSIGAAVQNMLLAIHEKGYGACWMNEPAIAGAEINKLLNVPLNQRFISLVPVGYPAYTPREKEIKGLAEVFSII